NVMMRPVILSTPVNSATGLLTRSARAGPLVASRAAVSPVSRMLRILAGKRLRPFSIMLSLPMRRAIRFREEAIRYGKNVARKVSLSRRTSSGTRRPGVVVAGHARTFLRGQHGAARPVCCGRTRQVRLVRLLPLARLVVLTARRDIGAVVHPAMPAGRDRRGFGIAVVNHPAARTPFGILAALVIAVAEFVSADLGAVAPCVEARAQRLAVPPRKELREKGLHRFLWQDALPSAAYGAHAARWQAPRGRIRSTMPAVAEWNASLMRWRCPFPSRARRRCRAGAHCRRRPRRK